MVDCYVPIDIEKLKVVQKVGNEGEKYRMTDLHRRFTETTT